MTLKQHGFLCSVFTAMDAYVLYLQSTTSFPSWTRGFEPRLPLHRINRLGESRLSSLARYCINALT
jgi:hypothetical protein